MSDKPTLSLNIGEIRAVHGEAVLSTVLGSCVSVCLFSESSEIGGMTHFALPDHPSPEDTEKLRYGTYAIRTLAEKLFSFDPRCRLDLKAKIVGGATRSVSHNEAFEAGRLNIEIARQLLSELEIQVVGEDVGGNRGRRILFHLPDGKLKVQDLNENLGHAIKTPPVISGLAEQLKPKEDLDHRKLLVIGASTGGTEALKKVLSQLPQNIPPTLIVQHIPSDFSGAFATRLNELCPFEVREAKNGDKLMPGRAYIAPGGLQMKLAQNSDGSVTIHVTNDPPVNRHKPSVDYLFNSVSILFGRKAVGVLMTGMGNDGAQGLLKLKEAGALTIAQDEKSSVVYGMPRVAREMGAAKKVCALSSIPHEIIRALRKS